MTNPFEDLFAEAETIPKQTPEELADQLSQAIGELCIPHAVALGWEHMGAFVHQNGTDLPDKRLRRVVAQALGLCFTRLGMAAYAYSIRPNPTRKDV